MAAVCLIATNTAAGNQPTTAQNGKGNINIMLSKYLNLDSKPA